MNTINNKETAVPQEQQSKLKQEAINEIIKILIEKNFTITEGREILNITSKYLGKQKITFSF